MSLYARLASRGATGFGYGSSAAEVVADLDLHGRCILVTGTSSGLGQETARVLLSRGARVIGTVRTAGSSGALVSQASFHEVICDLADIASVRACVTGVASEMPLDALIANAGIMALPTKQTVHGCERQLFTNHVGHFGLVTGLRDRLKDDARVVMLTSEAHRMAPSGPVLLQGDRRYVPLRAYGISKLANLLFAKALARRFAGTQRTANAVHPGVIQTNLGRTLESPLLRAAFAIARPVALKDIAQGAATQCLLAVHPAAAGINGRYWASCNVARSSAITEDVTLAETLWSDTEALLASI